MDGQEAFCIAGERRIGRFVIDQRLWQTLDLRIIRKAMRYFVVLNAVPMKDQPHLSVYTAYSHLFERVEPGAEPPQYDITVSKTGDDVTVTKREPEPSALAQMERALQGVV